MLTFKDKESLKEWLKTKEGHELLEDISTEYKYSWLWGTTQGKKFLGTLNKYMMRMKRIPVLIKLEVVRGRIFASTYCKGPVHVKIVTVPKLVDQSPENEIALEGIIEKLVPESHRRLMHFHPDVEEVEFKTAAEINAWRDRVEDRRWLFKFVEDHVQPACEMASSM